MSLLFWRDEDETRDTAVTSAHPLPVKDYSDPKSELWVSDWVLVPYGATSGALDANDALGDKFRFSGVPKKGRISVIQMADQDDDTLAATIHIFREDFTAAASDAAFTISVADSRKWVASEAFDAGTDLGSAKAHVIKNVNVDYYAPSGTLHCQLSSTGTPNIASADLMPLIRIAILPLE